MTKPADLPEAEGSPAFARLGPAPQPVGAIRLWTIRSMTVLRTALKLRDDLLELAALPASGDHTLQIGTPGGQVSNEVLLIVEE